MFNVVYCKLFPQLAAAMAPLTEEELELKLKHEYEQYLIEETSFLRQLGILQDDDTTG